MSEEILKKLEKIGDDAANQSKDVLTGALREAINLGRNSALEYIKMGTTVVPPAVAKQMGDLYLIAETDMLAGRTDHATAIVEKLNQAAASYGIVYKSQSAKRLQAIWQGALNIITKLISRLGSVATGGLSGLVEFGIGVVTDVAKKATP